MKNTILLLWLLMLGLMLMMMLGCAHKRASVPTPSAPTFGNETFGGKR